MSINIHPWQNPLWQKLAESRARLPHALLLRGRRGIGKDQFAQSLAKSLLCYEVAASGQSCGQCASCSWFALNSHPDFRLITPEEESAPEEGAIAKPSKKSRQISVAQIRELDSFLELSSHHDGGRRIVVISPAEALNMASANALLKILEEPPQGLIFILVSHQPYRLLPTIMSRCHKIDMPVPTESEAMEWLRLQGIPDAAERLHYVGGAPLLAFEADENIYVQQELAIRLMSQGGKLDAFSAAPLILANGMEAAINAIQKWIYDLFSCRLGGEIRYHSNAVTALQGLSKSVDLGMLLEYQRTLDSSRKSANHPLNNEVQLESLLLLYSNLFTQKINR